MFGVTRLIVRKLVKLCRKTQYVVISPGLGEFTGYFRELLQMAHHEQKEMVRLASQIDKMSANTVVPTFHSASLIADYSISLPTGLPAEVSSGWWLPYANWIVNTISPPDYSVELGVMSLDKMYGLSVRLRDRRAVLGHWHESCTHADVPRTTAELAFRVVASIVDHSSRR